MINGVVVFVELIVKEKNNILPALDILPHIGLTGASFIKQMRSQFFGIYQVEFLAVQRHCTTNIFVFCRDLTFKILYLLTNIIAMKLVSVFIYDESDGELSGLVQVESNDLQVAHANTGNTIIGSLHGTQCNFAGGTQAHEGIHVVCAQIVDCVKEIIKINTLKDGQEKHLLTAKD